MSTSENTDWPSARIPRTDPFKLELLSRILTLAAPYPSGMNASDEEEKEFTYHAVFHGTDGRREPKVPEHGQEPPEPDSLKKANGDWTDIFSNTGKTVPKKSG
jgi:hypothetical protein